MSQRSCCRIQRIRTEEERGSFDAGFFEKASGEGVTD
jgi:hypothetical protein